MKRTLYILYLVVVVFLVLALGSTDQERNDWDNGTSGSGWHSSGGHK